MLTYTYILFSANISQSHYYVYALKGQQNDENEFVKKVNILGYIYVND